MTCNCVRCISEKDGINKCLSEWDRKIIFEYVLSFGLQGGTLGRNI